MNDGVRLTRTSPGGGCSCKVPPGVLEELLERAGVSAASPLGGPAGARGELLCGTEDGDDAAVVRLGPDRAAVVTTDFFPPVVDDAHDWGRIAAANALSDVYAMGGEPLVALNDRPGPPGAAAAQRRRAAGEPLTLTKPLGLGILNNRHKVTGERFDEAVATMVELNGDASRAALTAGARAATDVTGFGLLGHLYKLARASSVSAVVDSRAVPYLDGTRASLAAGHVPGGTRRNLDWVRPHVETSLGEDELLLLADAQTSGGLLVCGEVPGSPVIGELVPTSGSTSLVVR